MDDDYDLLLRLVEHYYPEQGDVIRTCHTTYDLYVNFIEFGTDDFSTAWRESIKAEGWFITSPPLRGGHVSYDDPWTHPGYTPA